jgi:SAM-dependent methyltransferase
MITTDCVCPNCGKKGLSIFYKVNNVPVNSCVLLSTPQQALDFPCGDVILGFCKTCGFVSNVAFDPSKVDYESVYEDQQCFSSTFNAFAKNLVTKLIKKYNLHNKQIVEIGCGKGDFLALLCEQGHNNGVGIDPAFVKGRKQYEESNNLTFIRDFYSERYANLHGNFVCCRHTLEHIPNTLEFVDQVRKSIAKNYDTVTFFEVPDIVRVLDDVAFWDIYYEHCSYFSPGSLARLFRSCKFEILDLYREFDDQYLLIEAKPVATKSKKIHKTEESLEELLEQIKHFSNNYRKEQNMWKNHLSQLKNSANRVAVWGSGSKCVSFITTLKVEKEIGCVIDINPYRQGKFIPGTSKQIKPPEFLKTFNPDVTIVMNPIYRDEIKQMIDDMELSTQIISVGA